MDQDTYAQKLKYVVTMSDMNIETPILFEENLAHSFFRNKNIVSAGFCYLSDNEGNIKVSVFGESDSLNIKSRPEDKDLIYKALLKKEMFF